ncbi:microfibril-associated glycoprotein 4-like [Styela clava]
MGQRPTLFLTVIVCATCIHIFSATQYAPPYTCTTTTTLCKPGIENEGTNPVANRPSHASRPGKRGPVGPKGDKGDPSKPDPGYNSAITEMQRNMGIMESEMKKMNNTLQKLQQENEEFREMLHNVSQVQVTASTERPTSCKDYFNAHAPRGQSNAEGLAILFPFQEDDDLTTIEVNCILKESRSWMVIQRRINGSLSFNRQWEGYAEGFGNPNGEFWIGLRNLHKLTSSANYRLRIDLENWEGESRYAVYEKFAVKSEKNNFELEVSAYTGNAGDGMATHNGMGFTTSDRDNDETSSNCASSYPGGWWFRSCYGGGANLNGLHPKSEKDFHWLPWMDPETLKFSEMKIEQVN